MAAQSPAFSVTHFGFRRRPFQGSGVDFLRAHPGYDDAYNQLLDGIRFNRSLIVLLGEPGTGKSLLLGNLAHDPSVGLATVSCPPCQDFDALLADLCTRLALTVAGPERPHKLKALREYLSTAPGERLALIIDDADQMDENMLRQVLNLAKLSTRDGRFLLLVLAGSMRLEERLAGLRLTNLIAKQAAYVYLKPLMAAQVAQFIQAQLEIAGARPAELFSAEVVERIAQYSRGMPRQLNQLCSRVLAIAELSGQTSASPTMVATAAQDLGLSERSGATDSVVHLEKPPEQSAVAVTAQGGTVRLPALPMSRRRLAGLAALLATAAVAVWLGWARYAGVPVKPAAPPAATATPPSGTADIRGGERLLEADTIDAVRERYDKAAAQGDIKAMTALGRTYDPLVLQEHGLDQLPVDPVKAAEWYLKAGQAGDSEALQRLDRLLSWLEGKPAHARARTEILHRLSP